MIVCTYETSPDPRMWAAQFSADVGSFASPAILTEWFRRAMLVARYDEMIMLCALHPCPRCDAEKTAVVTFRDGEEPFVLTCARCGFNVNGVRAEILRHAWNVEYGKE